MTIIMILKSEFVDFDFYNEWNVNGANSVNN